MTVGSGKLLALPPRKLVTGAYGDYFISSSPFDTATWEGVPIGNRMLSTPIITHKGGYLSNGFAIDPEGGQTSPLTQFSVDYPFQQFGKGVESGAILRPPSMLLFDVNLAQSTNASPPYQAAGATQTTHLQTIWSSLITPCEDLLEEYNVFTGATFSMGQDGWPYIRGWLPAISETTSHYAANPYSETKRNFDASYFLGGNLLHLTVVYVNFINNGIASQYVERDQVLDPKTEYTDVSDDDIAAVAALGPRFNRYRKVVWYRWYRSDPDLIDVSDDLYDTHLAFQVSLADYFRFYGPYEARDNIGVTEDTNLYSLAIDEIEDFFSW